MTRQNTLNFRFDDFLNITNDAVVVIDEQQRIRLFNRSAEKVFGYRSSEIIDQPLDCLLPAKVVEVHRQHVRDFGALSENSQNMARQNEITGKKKDGTFFPADASIAKIKRGEAVYFIVFLRDITLRKQLEQDLNTWAQAFANAEWGVVVSRVEAVTIETINPAFARMYGYTIEELKGKPTELIFAPEDRPKFLEGVRQAHALGHYIYEARHLRKDGSIFPAIVDVTAVKDSEGKVLYRVVNVQDVTQLKQAETALRETEAHYGTIIQSLEEGVVLQDVEGKIYTCNASAERILGLTADQMMGRTSVDLRWRAIHEDGTSFPGDDHPAMLTLRSGEAYSDVIMGVHKADGTLTWISINTRPLFHPEEKQPYAVLSSFSDITERMQLYQVLEQRVEMRTRQLSALLDLSRTVASTMEIGPQLDLILTQLKTVIDYTGAGIAIIERDRFVILEYQGPTPREEMVNLYIPASQAAGFSEVIRRRGPLIIDDLWGDDPWSLEAIAQANEPMRASVSYAHSWMGVPLIVKDTLLGVLRLDHVEPRRYTEDHARLASVFAEQAAIAIEKSRLYGQAQELAALEERQKLARELHDSVSQALYGIGLGARTALTLLQRDPAKAAEPLEYCLSLAEAGLAEMRALIFELRPESLELEGLVAALSKQATALQARHAIRVELDLCEEPDIPLAIKETIYRIAQEALNNIVKHAHATQVDLHLHCLVEGAMVLEVNDNGQGFDPNATFPGHLGLSSMRERAERVGGQFEMDSSEGKGLRIRLEIPIQQAPSTA
jgi:PAS domain S-box-containing protein